MNRHNQQNSLTPKALIYRIVITVTALFIVCLYMPRDERSTYQFDVGKPWRYSQLIATYDFPIYKSTETIQTEQDSILQHYEPYFAIDETVGKEQIEKFKATINGQKPATIRPIIWHTWKTNWNIFTRRASWTRRISTKCTAMKWRLSAYSHRTWPRNNR